MAKSTRKEKSTDTKVPKTNEKGEIISWDSTSKDGKALRAMETDSVGARSFGSSFGSSFSSMRDTDRSACQNKFSYDTPSVLNLPP